jgi:phage terminase large subunit
VPSGNIISFERFYECIPEKFWEAIEVKNRIKIYMGGAGSGKSYTAFQEMIMNVCVNACNYLVLRQTAVSNTISSWALTIKLMNDWGIKSFFKINKSDKKMTFIPNGAAIVFRGMEDPERIKSVSFEGASGILERVLFEEASEGYFDGVLQLLLRMRGQSPNYFQLILLLNPVSEQNYIKKHFYDKDDFDVYRHHSTYLDNPFIDEFYRETLESFKESSPQYYKIYALGQWGQLSGQIFHNWERKTFPFSKEAIYDEILCGQDWGFNHPTSLTFSYIKDNCLYTFHEIIAFETTNPEYIKIIEEDGLLEKNKVVTYDPEDPARGTEFKNKGYSYVPAKKGKGSVLRTIDFINDFEKWYIDPSCVRLLQEVELYHWKTGKNPDTGENITLDEPVKFNDDAIDSVRYAIEHLANMKGKPSVLSGGKSESKKSLIELKKEERKKRREVMKAQRKQQKVVDEKK